MSGTLPSYALLALSLALWLPSTATARPVKTAQGDLSQVGDVGPGPTDLEALLTAELGDAEARRLFDEIRELILQDYAGGEVSEKDLYVGALAGMLEVLNRGEGADGATPDRNALMTSDQSSYVDQMLAGHKTGIGIEFQAGTRDGALVVTRVYDGSPAERSGILAGDRIVGIDGHALRNRELSRVIDLLRGAPGTPIGLTLARGVTPVMRIDVVLTREVYDLPSIEVELLADDVALARVSQFHGDTAEEARVVLAHLVGAGVESLVLDLRGNQGGLLASVQDVASLFLVDGSVIGRVQDAQGRERDLTATGPRAFSGPMVCLVNRWTSSGAELLASALQENGRAAVIGERTAGKATTESMYEVGSDLDLRLTSATLLSPLGRSWSGEGLTPDYVVGARGLDTDGDDASGWPMVDVQVSFALRLVQDDEAP